MLANSRRIKRKTFRWLVFGEIISFVYDIIWILELWEEYMVDSIDIEFDKPEMGIKHFALYTSALSIAFRPIVIAAFWRASIDFKSIVRGSR